MHRFIILAYVLCLSLIFQTPAFIQDAGASDDTEEEVFVSPYSGLRGQFESRVAHDLCPDCFTVPNLGEGYRIFESIPIGEDSEHIITRYVANPAPLEPGEVRPTVDDDGEPLWYIGTQGYSGPQDTVIMHLTPYQGRTPPPSVHKRLVGPGSGCRADEAQS